MVRLQSSPYHRTNRYGIGLVNTALASKDNRDDVWILIRLYSIMYPVLYILVLFGGSVQPTVLRRQPKSLPTMPVR